MAINVYVDKIMPTSARVVVDGIDTNYDYIYIQFQLRGQEPIQNVYPNNGIWHTNLAGLTPDTTYTVDITLAYVIDPETYINPQYANVRFTTAQQIGDPTYTAYGENSNIYISVQNLPSTQRITYYLCDPIDPTIIINSYSSSYAYFYYFSNLSDGNYKVAVDYLDSQGNPQYILNGSYQIYTDIQISGGSGPTPGGNWSYDPGIFLSIVDGYGPYAYTYDYQHCKVFVLRFDNSGTFRFFTSSAQGSIQVYFDTFDNGYDNSTGIPIGYSSPEQTGIGFDFNKTITSNTSYYLWIKSTDQYQQGSFQLNIEVATTPVIYPTFTASVINNNQIQIFVQNRASDQYLRYFVRLESDENDHTYDTFRDVGHLVQDDTITVINLLYNTWYRINVGYSDNPNSGLVDWIIKSTDDPYLLKTGSQPISGSYVYIYTGSGANQGWKKAIPYIYTGSGANQGWKQAQAYIFNGTEWKRAIE